MLRCLSPIPLLLLTALHPAAAQVPIVGLDAIEARLGKGGDTVYVVNLWATWCGPCVRELPYFEALQQQFADQRVKVLLVSLDFPEQLESKVLPFITSRGIRSETMLLDEADPNSWIPRISPDWSGAIPATLFVCKAKGVEAFVEGSFHEGELEAALWRLRLL